MVTRSSNAGRRRCLRLAVVATIVASSILASAQPATAATDFFILQVSTSPAPLQPGAAGTITITTTGGIVPAVAFTVVDPHTAAPVATVTGVTIESTTRATIAVDVASGLAGTYALLATDGTTQVANARILIGTGVGTYHPIAPVRALDTRVANGWAGPLASGATARVRVGGIGAIPTTDVAAVVATLTAVDSTGDGYLTAYASGIDRPDVSNLNFTAGTVVPNQVVVQMATDGYVNIFNFGGVTHVLLDVVGWYGGAGAPLGYSYSGNTSVRVLDTRSTTPLAAGATLRVAIPTTNTGGNGSASTRRAVEANITVTRPEAAGFLTAYAAGTSRPNTSTNNFAAARSSASAAVVETGTDGAIDIYNGSRGAVDVIVDVRGGYYVDRPYPYHFVAVTPFRAFDTRRPGFARPAQRGEFLYATAPASLVPADASYLVGNVTAVEPTGAGYLNIDHGGLYFPAFFPLSSVLNFTEGRTVANAFTSSIGADNSIVVYNNDSPTHVLVDGFGWFVG